MPGATPQAFYYGTDQIGSVRRVFASTSNAPAYSYDPYGKDLQATASLTDFRYAGMLFNADSGLYLATYRSYDVNAGRWLSRDPLGESSDAVANLYAYVQGNPISFSDAEGLFAFGISFSVSTINPFTSGGGGNYGINLEYTSSCGLHLYGFGTPNGQPSTGFSLGAGVAVNAATGTGSWEGPFLQDEGNIGPASGGGFESPGATLDNGGYIGAQIGAGVGAPVGLGATVTNYTKWY